MHFNLRLGLFPATSHAQVRAGGAGGAGGGGARWWSVVHRTFVSCLFACPFIPAAGVTRLLQSMLLVPLLYWFVFLFLCVRFPLRQK